MKTTEILPAIARKRFLIVGDLMLDHYIWGEVSRISPEAPVPVIHVLRETYTAGGAANVALNTAALGGSSALFGSLGDDEAGRRLAKVLASSRIDSSHCVSASDRATIVKTRVIARTQQVCRIDREAGRNSYSLDALPDLDPRLERAVAEADAIIVSDYAKGVVTQRLLDRLIALARETGKLLAIDPKPARRLNLRGAHLITPNRGEALDLAGLPEPGFGEPYPLEEVCRRIHTAFAPEILVVTLGADGMAVSINGRIEHLLPTEAREVFDVSGAGDTVIATLTAALAAGAGPVDAARLANRAAGIVVSKIGTVTVSAEELASFE
jgi:D-glycero-beta-D-manno-heptose-7-phosphate kinase